MVRLINDRYLSIQDSNFPEIPSDPMSFRRTLWASFWPSELGILKADVPYFNKWCILRCQAITMITSLSRAWDHWCESMIRISAVLWSWLIPNYLREMSWCSCSRHLIQKLMTTVSITLAYRARKDRYVYMDRISLVYIRDRNYIRLLSSGLKDSLRKAELKKWQKRSCYCSCC